MESDVVLLILGGLVIAYAVYFTHSVLRRQGGSLEAGVSRTGLSIKVTASERSLVIHEARLAAAQRQQPSTVGEGAAERVLATLENRPSVHAIRCLWVDDRPEGNVHERRMLEHLKVEIDVARSTSEALQILIARRFDLIITDLARPAEDGTVDPVAGVGFLELLAGAAGVPPVIVYAGSEDGRFAAARKAGAAIVTTEPLVLLQSVLDMFPSEVRP